ncbi:MAG TPA: hypothetical protein VMZ03_03860 [Chitinophagaceae bacterium]|nr:hypothetical protein [Chitinophagaceae bacterium]
MSTTLCGFVGGNTGGVLCDTKRKTPKKIFLGSKEFSSSEYADPDTLAAAILTACNLNNGNSAKLFPLQEIYEVAVTTEADTKGKLALGPERRLRKGKPSYTYSFETNLYQYQKYLAWDDKVVPAFTLDSANNFWGYRAGAAAYTVNTSNFKGEQVYVTVSGNGFEDGNAATTGICTISISYLSVEDFEKRGTYATLPATTSAGDFNGLKDVMLYEPQAHASNVYKIKMVIPISKLASDLDIYDDHAAAIAAMTFTAFTGATYGSSLTITSVAVDATLKALTVTFDSTAFTALSAATKIKLVPPTVATLVAAGITGLELASVIVVK